MQVSTRDAERLFAKLRITPKRSTHHVMGWIELDGRKVLPVHYSHGRKDMPGNIPTLFRQSLLVTVEEFAELRDCSLSREAYLELLRDRLHLAEH